MKKILLLGALLDKKDPTKTGGITVLFELLLEELRKRKVDFEVIDTYRGNYSNSLTAYFCVIIQLFVKIYRYDHISLQASKHSITMIGPIMIILAKIFNKQSSIRKFAGDFNVVHRKANSFQKFLIEFVLKNSDVNFFETKYLVDYFKVYNKNTYWFPNVRRQQLQPLLPRKYRKRFVYIGTINEEKGIDELCLAVKNLSNDYTVDLYGPIIDTKYSKNYFKKLSINYKGALKSEDVIKTINEYDVLVLPSYREGYPGVIIEAFSLGIPVIATKLPGIMEMVEDNQNGFLVSVKNTQEIIKAIEMITEEKYKMLSEKAYESFKNFNSDKQTNMFLEKIG